MRFFDRIFLLSLLLLSSLAFGDSETTFSGKTAQAHIIQSGGVSIRPRPYLDFEGITCADTNGKSVCTGIGNANGINWSTVSGYTSGYVLTATTGGSATFQPSSGGSSGPWGSSGSNVYLINSANNVGVGLSSPSYKLDVTGTIGDSSDGNLNLQSQGGSVHTYNNTLDDGSGNLTAVGNLTGGNQLIMGNSYEGIDTTVGISMLDSSGASIFSYIGTDRSDNLNFGYTGSSQNLGIFSVYGGASIILGSGGVGVGAYPWFQPSYSMDINGDIGNSQGGELHLQDQGGAVFTQGNTLDDGNSESTFNNNMTLNGGLDVSGEINVIGPLTITGGPTPRIIAQSNDPGNGLIVDRGSGQGNYDLDFGENTDTGKTVFRGQGSFYFGDQTTPALAAIGRSGNVGVNSTNPGQRLDVVGTVRATNMRATSISGSTQCVQADSSGNLSGTGSACGAGGSTGLWNTINTNDVYEQSGSTFGNVGIGTSFTTGGRLIIKGGNVGIGSLSPGAVLDVVGTLRVISPGTFSVAGNTGLGQSPDGVHILTVGTRTGQTSAQNSDGIFLSGNSTNEEISLLTSGNHSMFMAYEAGGAYFGTGSNDDPIFRANNGDGARLQASTKNWCFGGSCSPGSTVSSQNNLSVGGSYDALAAPSNGAIIQGNVGIGSANPGMALDVVGTVRVINAVYAVSQTTAPTIASNDCGSLTQGTVNSGSTDLAGSVSTGTAAGSVLSCAITFGQSHTTAPAACVCQDGTTPLALSATPTSTKLTCTALATLASGTISYQCQWNKP